MKHISSKSIFAAWVIALLATVSFVLALTISHCFLSLLSFLSFGMKFSVPKYYPVQVAIEHIR